MSDARENARIPEESDRRGHDIGDREARTPREDREPAKESTEITRTTRDGSGNAAERTTRTREDDGRDPIPGNTSETGVGSPVADGTSGRSAGRTPVGPPMGCTRTASIMLFVVSISFAIVMRQIKR